MDAMLKAKIYDDAVKFGLEYVKGSPTNPEGHLKLAQIYEAKSMNKESAASYKMAGDNFLKQKAEIKAKEAYDKAMLLEKSGQAAPSSVTDSRPQTVNLTPNPVVEQQIKKQDDLVIERGSVGVPEQPVKPKADPMRQSFIDSDPVRPKAEIKQESESPKPVPVVQQVPQREEVTPLTEAKGDIDELFIQTEKHMKDGFFEKAIEIYRVILKKEPRNNTVRQKLHQAYLLLAQQEEEIGNKTAAPKKDAPKEKKSKISYL